tara:strand:+ start:22034 stop:22960 length:927 start_codon:yes stop_codon:yes gene_type:complete
MLKNIKKIFNIIIDENIYKYLLKKNKLHSKKFYNIAYPGFDVIGPHISVFGRFEDKELKVLEEKIFNKIDTKNTTCIDIGANIGNHSVFFSKFFFNIDSFEPHPDSFNLLKFNTKDFNNVRVFNFGTSDTDEKKYLYTPDPTNTGFSTLNNEGLESIDNNQNINEKKKEVELKNLDLFYKTNKTKKISFIKIDVEGHEYKSLSGMKNIIEKDSPIIALEQFVGQFDKKTKSTQSIDFLKENSYKFFYEPLYFQRKKNKNKAIRALNKFIFILQILFGIKRTDEYNIKKIDRFDVKSYPMILASKFSLD